jgi:dephospho-CoA kinase
MPVHNSQEPPDKRLVVGVTGRIGAGKTSVARYLSEAHGFFYVRYSQVLSEWKAHNAESKKLLQAIGWEVMGGGMQLELNQRLIAQIPPDSNCAVDGLRHPIDFDSLAKSFSTNFYLIYVDCTQETRWQRLRARYPRLEDFQKTDFHPVEQNIETLRNNAFAVIDNNSSLQHLHSELEQLLNKFHVGGRT